MGALGRKMSEKYHLKWNDFHRNIGATFSNLQKEDDFCDVTLVGDDYVPISAHKVVLSSCSEYFKNILKLNKHSHPLLCLENVKSEELMNVLNYIYQGEIRISQEEINKFLLVATRFQLNGLVSDHPSSDRITPSQTKFPQTQSKQDFLKADAYETTFVSNDNKNIIVSPSSRMELQDSNLVVVDNSTSLQEIDQRVSEMVASNGNGEYYCKMCGKTGKHLGHIRAHSEIHLMGVAFPCSICGKHLRSRNALSLHLSRKICQKMMAIS